MYAICFYFATNLRVQNYTKQKSKYNKKKTKQSKMNTEEEEMDAQDMIEESNQVRQTYRDLRDQINGYLFYYGQI